MAHNILWHGEIFFHMYMDEKKKWMNNINRWKKNERIKWMKNENKWTKKRMKETCS